MNTRARAIGVLIPVAVVMVACTGSSDPPPDTANSGPTPRTRTLETQPMHLDQIFTSMQGPYDRVSMNTSDIDWVTGFSAEVVDAETDEKMGDEFFCHSQVQLPNTTRLLVTATGTETIDFPDGFAMPVSLIVGPLEPEQRQLSLLGMLLNNHEPDIDRMAKVRWTIDYWQRSDPEAADLKTLYKAGLGMAVEDQEAYGAVPPSEDVSTHCVLVDGNTSHWIVPPGPQRTRRTYSDIVPVESSVHYAAVHLHNHGVFMKLTDVTTGEELWRTDVIYEKNRRQIADIPMYSSVEGFTIYPDRAYEIEAYYENITDQPVDAMAMMYLYYHPKGNEVITYPESPAPIGG